ncbi:hypothetical protein FACS1894139_18070 [Planctomycetales bacterium]|nr:hypothetical protein FACS1894139_18070 [Planctomycetales bacterium]
MRAAIKIYLLWLFCLTPVFAADYSRLRDLTPDERRQIEALRGETFSLGCARDHEAFINQDGNIDGNIVKFAEYLSALLGIKFVPQIVDGAAPIADPRLDFALQLPPTENAEKFWWTSPVRQRPLILRRQRAAPPLAERPRYGFLAGSVALTFARPLLPPDAEIVELANQDEIFAALADGRIDAAVEEMANCFYDRPETAVEIFSPTRCVPSVLITGKPRLAPVIGVVEKALRADGAAALANISGATRLDYRQFIFRQSLTAAEREYLDAQTAPLPVAWHSKNYPMSWRAPTGEVKGIATDVLQKIGRLTGLTFTSVNPDAKNEAEQIAALFADGRALITDDVLQVATDTALRAEPYYTENHALISRKNLPPVNLDQLAFLRVGALRDSRSAEVFRRQFPFLPLTAIFDAPEAALAALNRGEIDLFMGINSYLLLASNFYDYSNLKINYVFSRTPRRHQFTFSPRAPLLRDIFNKAQALIDLSDILAQWEWSSFDYREEARRERTGFYYAIVGLFALVVALAGLLIWRSRRLTQIMLIQARMRDNLAASREKESRVRDQLLVHASHEIRTPLNAIIGMAAVARKHAVTPKVVEAVEQINAAGKHLLGVINDILDMSKIKAGKLTLTNLPFALQAALDEVADIITARCVSAGLNLKRDFAFPPALAVFGDRLRLSQVLLNLLGNAVKFTPRGGEIVFRARALVESSAKVKIAFAVQDNGIGMSREQLGRVFKAYEQANSTTSARYGGTGLGLAISQEFIKSMGGTIRPRSQLNRGSLFRFVLTFNKTILVPAAALTDDAPTDFTGKRLLLVEDIEVNRLVVREMLAETNIEIDEAENGKEAVNKFMLSPWGYYDVVFMDVQMPVLDGYDATRQMRAAPRPDAVSTLIIAMTADAYREDIDRAIAAGMNDHIAKPVNFDNVIKILTDHFSERN